jgi:iron complex outermembrane receptor protein
MFVYDDNHVTNTPAFSGMAGLQYRHASGFFAASDVFYTGKLYWDDANEYSRNDMTTVNARIGYESDDFNVYLYGKNIFGERYLEYFSDQNMMAFTAPPQMFGVEFIYKF